MPVGLSRSHNHTVGHLRSASDMAPCLTVSLRPTTTQSGTLRALVGWHFAWRSVYATENHGATTEDRGGTLPDGLPMRHGTSIDGLSATHNRQLEEPHRSLSDKLSMPEPVSWSSSMALQPLKAAVR